MVNTLNSENRNFVKIYHFSKNRNVKENILVQFMKILNYHIYKLTFHKIENYLVLLSTEIFANAFKRLM